MLGGAHTVSIFVKASLTPVNDRICFPCPDERAEERTDVSISMQTKVCQNTRSISGATKMPTSPPNRRRDDAQRLWRVRDSMGLSQREFAKELGVTPGAVAQWEGRKRSIPGPVLKLLEIYERELGMKIEKEEGLERIEGSWFKRTSRLSRTAAGVTAQLAGAAIQSLVQRDSTANPIAARAQRAVAERFVHTLGDMKGLAMKMGQMVSFLDFALPPEARKVL